MADKDCKGNHVDYRSSVGGSLPASHRLVDLVEKASPSRAEGPGFDSRPRRGDLSGSSPTSD